MRATHTDPRLLLIALATAFAFALLAAAAPSLDMSDLGLTSGGATPVEAPAAQPADKPAWVEDPMASPLTELRAP